jgi:hypothetical protein
MSPLPRPVESRPVVSGNPDTRRGRAKGPCPTCGELPRPRRKRDKTDEDYRRAMLAMVSAYSRRIATSGLSVLADVVALRDAIDLVIDAGVELCRSDVWSASWAEIAEATGLPRSTAQERWSSLGGARRVGGQPSSLR